MDILVEPVDRRPVPRARGDRRVRRGARAGRRRHRRRTAGRRRLRLGARLVVWPDRVAGSLGSRRGSTRRSTDDARGLLAAGHTGVLRLGPDGERRLDELAVLVESMAPPPRMLVFGAIDFAAAVARVGAFLGFHVTVCDARPVFATARRFPEADEVVVEWPHRYLADELAAGRVDAADGDLRADPRPEVRRAAAGDRAAHPGGVHRGDGLAAHPRGPARSDCARSGSASRSWPGWPRRSGWTSAPVRRRRPPSRSPPRSSRPGGGVRASGWACCADRSTTAPTSTR